MSVRFLCQTCKGLLKTGRRKIGTNVECPKCGGLTRVPSESTAAVELAMARGSRDTAKAKRSEGLSGSLDEFVVYDFDHDERSETTTPRTSAVLSGGMAAGRRPTGRRGDSWLLVQRRALYVQAGLLAFIGLLCLGAGVLIGVGLSAARPVEEALPGGPANGGGEAFTWQLDFRYTDASGQAQADEGAVVLALPAGKARAQFAGAPLAPGAPAPPQAVLLALAYQGGAHARADAFGRAQLRLPRPGEYTLVFISAHVEHDQDKDAADALAALEPFFSDAARIIAARRVRLDRRALSAGAAEEQVHFGAAAGAP
jgi:hypothetical protein